jgi:putative endonuclease
LRFEQHQNGEVENTKYCSPLKPIYFAACANQQDALREKYFKTHDSKIYLKNRLVN